MARAPINIGSIPLKVAALAFLNDRERADYDFCRARAWNSWKRELDPTYGPQFQELDRRSQAALDNALRKGDLYCTGRRSEDGEIVEIPPDEWFSLRRHRLYARALRDDGSIAYEDVKVVNLKWSERDLSADDLLKASTPGVKAAGCGQYHRSVVGRRSPA
jgi:hypothetical protein